MKHVLIIPVMLLAVFTACGGDNGDDGAKAASVSSALRQGGEETVHFTTSDGVVIAGTMYISGSSPRPTLLCLHQWRADRSTYAALAKALVVAGYNVLAIDMRGYGESNKTADGKTVRPDREAVKDVEAAMTFLRSNPAVDGKRIGIIGASYGSSNALIYAAGDPGVKTLVLLSPGLNYFHVLPTEPAVRKYGPRPMLVVASSEDVRSVEAVDVYKKLGGAVTAKIYDNAGHGTEILDAKKDLAMGILDFLRTSL
jgi:pimeloyl-ACP methyl ester carboxylesterase